MKTTRALIVRSGLAVVVLLATGSAQASPFQSAPGPAAPSQPPRSGNAAPALDKGIVRGRVIDADTGVPLRRAQVFTTFPTGPATAQIISVLTDDQGRYEFKLAPGRYAVTASKAGYVRLGHGQRRPGEGGRSIDISGGQMVDKIDIMLPRAGVIVVRVTDDAGEVVMGMGVELQQYEFGNGGRRLVPLRINSTAATNDLGVVRLSSVPPGEYFVKADSYPLPAGVDDKGQVFPATYFPGTFSVAEAQRVSVATGQEVNVEIRITSVKPARVSGVVRGVDGALLNQPSVVLRAAGTAGGRNMSPQADGSFSLANVMPGDYTIEVSPSWTTGNANAEYASVPVRVTGEDLSGLLVTTRKGATLRGRFVFDGATPPAALRPGMLEVSVAPTGTGTPSARLMSNDDWTFELGGLTGSGVIGLLRPVLPGWYLKAVMLDGKDVIDTPVEFSGDVNDVEIHVTQKATTVTGIVVNSRNSAVNNYVVVIFPDDRDQWTLRSRFIATGRPDQQSRFRIAGLPPGRYLAAAVDNLVRGEEQDPDLLNRLQGVATRMTLGEGESKTVSLKLTPR